MKKISFEPISVKNSISEMKNIAELMIDLAYSSLLFRNLEISDEVMKLEEQVHVLTYLVDMNTMLAVRDSKDAEELEPIIRIGYNFDRISNAIADIAKITINKLDLHPTLFEAIRQSEEPLIRAIVTNKEINNKKIGKLQIRSETGCDIIAIRRGNGWIFDPTKDTKLKLNDVLFARGSVKGNQLLCNMTGGQCTRGEKEKENFPIELEHDLTIIKQYILEMKNTSEAMIGLAFSAILFNNREIAEDVFEMEERLDFVQLEVQKSVLANAKCVNDPTRFVSILRLATATEEISDGATSIAEIVLRGLEPHPVFEIIMNETDEIISKIQISEKSKIVNQTISESNIQINTGMKVIAIKRNNDYFYGINKNTMLLPEDVLITVGPEEGKQLLMEMAK
ncbi:MAG: hypothetical protein EAX96_08710 [Candidatus Lokiarchaeota archaeon]|nr:hypothetical protein [Candidatus Lokiarchaeota archaeon]